MLYLLYLDAYHQADPLFLEGMARVFGARGTGRPACLGLHGSGETAGRLLEAEGLFPSFEAGRPLVTTPEEKRIVEQAVREANRKIVGRLTEQIVAAVGIHGVDRGLLRAGADGVLRVGRLGWLLELCDRGVVPILSTLVAGDPEEREAPLQHVAATLVEALGAHGRPATVVFFPRVNRPGLMEDGAVLDRVPARRLPGPDVLPDAPALVELVEGGTPVLITNPTGLMAEKGPTGTVVFSENP